MVGIVGMIVMVLVLLYIPPVQDFAVGKVLDTLNSKGEMHLDVKKLRLAFPLRLSVDTLSMQTPGMEIAASSLRTRVEVLPLITGKLNVPLLAISDAVVNIGTPDSTLYMRANLRNAALEKTSVSLTSSSVNVGNLLASGGVVNMILSTDTVPPPATESAPVEWKIALTRAELDSISYHMEYDPTIIALDCDLPEAILTDGEIDLATSNINVGSLIINRVDAKYITPSEEYTATHPTQATEVPADTVASTPWTINARKIQVNNAHAIYASDGAVPSRYFNPSFIEASEIDIEIESFMNRGTEITVPIKKISARESCGISLFLSGTFAMDSTAMHADNFALTTATSAIWLNALMGMEKENAPIQVKMDAEIGMDDIRRLAPASMQPIVAGLPQFQPLKLNADIDGTMDDINVNRLSAEIPRHIAISADGRIADYTDMNRAYGKLAINGNIADGNFIKKSLFDAKMRRTVDIPPLRLTGSATMNQGVIDGELRAYTKGGDIALDAMWNNRAEGYDIEAGFNGFPVNAILPTAGIGNLTASISARGEGLDFFSSRTHADARVDLTNVEYNGGTYRNITLDASMANGNATVNAQSSNPAINFDINARGNLAGEQLDWTFTGDVRRLDLRALALADTTAEGALALTGRASYTPPVAATRRTPGRPMTVHSAVDITSVNWKMPDRNISGKHIYLTFNTADSLTNATIRNNDLVIDFSSPAPLDTLLGHLSLASARLDRDMKRRRLAIDSLQQALPKFNLNMSARNGKNILSNILAGENMSIGDISVSAANDTIIHADARVTRIKSGDTRVDTITANLSQRGSYLLYDARMNNRPGTFDQFADVNARGYISSENLSLIFRQQNIKGETGYSIGLMAQMPDSNTVSLRFVPFHPIIGYKDWEINKDNIIKFNLASKHLDANLYLHNQESSLRLFTDHTADNDSVQEDINLQIKDIKLADWIAVNPFAPPITGNLSADMKVHWAMPDINGTGSVTLSDFFYDRRKVGDFVLDIDVSTNDAGTVRASTSLTVDGVKSITAVGNLNDSTASNPFLLDFRMIHFPLSVVNPFLPPGTASLSGTLNGVMDITGSMGSPSFNGYVEFDSTTIDVTMLGTPFRFSEERIPMENNVVTFKDFSIYGVNSRPLLINGNVNLKDFASPRIDLAFTARDMQVIGSQKSRKSQAYGKAFINLDADVKGTLSFLDINANLSLLAGTNVTYVIPDAVNAITSRSAQDMVKFVNFNDTTEVEEADTVARPPMLMNIDAQLTVSTGTTITVELSTDGKNKVQLLSNGVLSYTQDFMNDQHFTGRLNLTGGYVRYSIPVMGEKLFNFQEGSYVSFNGNMMNPILNVHAIDPVRANVSVNNSNRVVNFDVGLGVTGTLEDMNVAFDLSCTDDITIANELKSMTAEQRANQAMNLLISGIYRSGGTQTISGGNVGTNALFGFLESQLNNWASSAIKGVDISFGIDQYDKTVDGANTTAMSYSYQVSKSLFNDRFKIVVGGNYTTDAEADENFAQNLISDISFEYMLNRAGTKYIRLFRHTGYESILEGEITQTGVGFVYKKKIRRLGEVFRFLTPKKKKPATPAPEPVSETDAQVAIPPTSTNSQTAADDEQKQ